MKFQVGDKVVPINKTVIGYGSLNKSNNWRKAKEKGQGFLFVSKFDEEVNAYVCSHENGAKYGDYFNETDLKNYKDKPTKNQRITALEKEVATLKEDIESFKSVLAKILDIKKPTEITIGNPFTIEQKLTPNQRRKAIIDEAKAFVEENLAKNHPNVQCQDLTNGAWFVNGVVVEKTVEADFVVNDKKRTVVALIRNVGKGKVRSKGIAKCAPDDVFNEHIGKAIALGRALGLDVSEFEQAVQPEVAPGQVVEYGGDEIKVYAVNPTHRTHGKGAGFKFGSIEKGFTTISENDFELWLYLKCISKIVDDTNAQYEEVK